MKDKYIEDLQEIKQIMNRTSRFISLSGLSGVSTGAIALLGAAAAYQMVFKGEPYLTYEATEINSGKITALVVIATATLILSIAAAIFFTTQKTKKLKENVWDLQTKRLLVNLSIPLLTGGAVCLIFLYKGYVGILPPLTMIFYGLALVNGSKYTIHEIKSLGLIEIAIGLIAMLFINHGLLFWALGFGIVQTVYGVIVQTRYKP